MTWESLVWQKASLTRVGRNVRLGRASHTNYFFWEPTRPACLPFLVIWEGEEKKKAINEFSRFYKKEHPK